MVTAPDEREALLSMVSDFMRSEVAPRVGQYDLDEQMPRDILDRMSELGFFGGVLPPENGGLGLDYLTFAALIEEVSKVCHILGTFVSMPSGLVGAALDGFGSDAQKEQWLKPLAEGRMFGAAAVTEPRSGSDVAGMTTTYYKDGDSFVINGAKAWISNLDVADFVITFASYDRSLRHQGISAFVIPRGTPGMTFHPYRNKLGFRPITTGEIALQDVRVGTESLLGEEGQGFHAAMAAVERGRLGVAARSVGVAQACLDDSVAYAREREVFERSLAEFQLVQSKITDMAVGVETARLLVQKTAMSMDAGLRSRKLTSMAKMYASDVAQRSATDAMQILGAAGVAPESRVGRFYRDSKVLQIVEGSNDIHRALIGEITLGRRSDGEKERRIDEGAR